MAVTVSVPAYDSASNDTAMLPIDTDAWARVVGLDGPGRPAPASGTKVAFRDLTARARFRTEDPVRCVLRPSLFTAPVPSV